MKSGTSFFNAPLFRKTVLRFWPLWFSYAFVLALALPVRLAGRLGHAVSELDALRLAQYVPLEFLDGIGKIAAPAIGCAAAMAVYSHLYFQRSASAYGMLPVRREGIFWSLTLAGLLPVLAVNLLAALACLAAGAGQFEVLLPATAAMFAGTSLMVLAYFGIAAFCAQLTGSIIVLPVLFIAVNIAAAVFQGVLYSVLGEFVYGYTARDQGMDLLLFSPLVGMLAHSQYQPVYEQLADGSVRAAGYIYTGWAYSAGCAAVGALLLWPSCVLYKRRRLETAGDVVAIGILRPVFRYCAATACALLLAVLLADLLLPNAACMGVAGALIFAGFMLLGGLIGWLAAEMLVQKSFRVFRMGRKWLGFGALWLLLTALLMCGELDVTGYERRVPQADEVVRVELSYAGDSMTLSSRENVEAVLSLHESIIEGKEQYETAGGQANGELGYIPYNIRFSYELEDGGRMQRRYYVSLDAQDAGLLESVSNTVEGILSRKLPSIEPALSTVNYAAVNWVNGAGEVESLTLSAAEALELYRDCILPDMSEGNIGLVWYCGGELENTYDCRINIDITRAGGPNGYDYSYFYTYATVYSERTNAWLEAHGVLLRTPKEQGRDFLLA